MPKQKSIPKANVAVASQVLPQPARSAPADPAPPSLRHLAHELRTPLAAIQSLSDALASGHLGPPIDPRHADYLVLMRETARHALAVVERMLLAPATPPQPYAAGGSGDPALPLAAPAVDANAIAAEILAALAPLASRTGVRMKRSFGQDLPLVSAGPTELRQMLINLVANALDHAGPAATIAISTGKSADAGEVWIAVADNGPGFPAGVAGDLLRGDDAGSSPATTDSGGIGLRLTRALVTACGGRLEIGEAAPSAGAPGAEVRLVLKAASPIPVAAKDGAVRSA